MTHKYIQLRSLLRELFQLDQPDLDFGLYRVLRAKSAEVTQFLDRDLLPQVQAAFGLYKASDKSGIELELAKAIEQAHALGADTESLPKVKQLRAQLADDAVDVGQLESEVYDHLFRFFRRYYADGDFVAKRVYKPGVYAIPYEGEEVAVHWANKDQYYIKTSEYLRDYAFCLCPDDADRPMRVHFRLSDAAEGEHGNVKVAENKDRVFVLARGTSAAEFATQEPGQSGPELVIRFAYRPATLADWPADSRAGKTRPPAQKDLTALAVRRLLAAADAELGAWMAALRTPHVTASGEPADYCRLEAHLRRYTARNTVDYFIHKDLGGFLRRELDFYIKNEVMHLDDIERESAPRVEQYLSKIKVIRRVAGKVIDFLAQLEEFQKKLWLKQKFVVETHYCIAIGAIAESFYPQIAACDAQRQEWVKLCRIDTLAGDQQRPAYSVPLTPAFLRAHPTLMVDTRNLDATTAEQLIAAVADLDQAVAGVVCHAENVPMLRLMAARYREQVNCVYLDPPYNTGGDDFAYKDGYQHSSWMAAMEAMLRGVQPLLHEDYLLGMSIDGREHMHLRWLADFVLGTQAHVSDVANVNNPQGRSDEAHIATAHEQLLVYAGEACRTVGWKAEENVTRRYRNETEAGERFRETDLRKTGKGDRRQDRPNMYYYFHFNEATHALTVSTDAQAPPGHRGICPIRPDGSDGRWRWGIDTARARVAELLAKPMQRRDEWTVYQKDILDDDPRVKPASVWSKTTFNSHYASDQFANLGFAKDSFPHPKPVDLIAHFVALHHAKAALVVDAFGGSGTTAHAVITHNYADGGRRKFILGEMGPHFETVLLPRIKKVAFAPEWLDGKPKRVATVEQAGNCPRIVKVLRLESYEDSLNNLEVRRTDQQQQLLASPEAQGADGLAEQYRLRYMLNVETRGSPSLLNIDAFRDPTCYGLLVKRPGSTERRKVNVDLLETFNWLVGIAMRQIAAPQTLSAAFERDPERRLRLVGPLQHDAAGSYWFRTVTGTLPDGRKALVIWRKLPSQPEQDNLVLDEWFAHQGYGSKGQPIDVIWVNGGNNLANMKSAGDRWKVRLIEEDFHRLMFAGVDA